MGNNDRDTGGDLTPQFLAETKRTNDLMEESLTLQRMQVGARHLTPDGTYELGSYYNSGSDTREALKALATSNEALERTERAARDLGFTGDRLVANVMMDVSARTAILAQCTHHPRFFEASQRWAKYNTIAKGDMYGGTNASGGYAVPDIVGNEVLKIIRDASVIYSRVRQVPMTSDTLSFPDESTAVTHQWVAEGGTLTSGEPVFGVKSLTAKKLACRAVFSLELLDDSNVSLIPFLQSCFAERMGGELDFQAVEGPGTVFTGVLFASSVVSGTATNGTIGTVLQYNATSTKSGLVQIYTGAGEGITRNDGIFVCGPGVYAKILGLVDTNGQPIVRLGTVEGQPNNTIFGRPIIVSNRLTTFTVGAGTASVGGLYYGSPSALLFGNRQGMKWDVTDQVHWGTYQADARLVGRFGYVVGVPTAWVKQANILV